LFVKSTLKGQQITTVYNCMDFLVRGNNKQSFIFPPTSVQIGCVDNFNFVPPGR
jgi:hypothetical protein